MYLENVDQKALRLWIMAGVNIPEVCNLCGDAGYILNNMIAKYTLAANQYQISKAAYKVLKEEQINLKNTYKRRQFYGKDKLYMYEHSIPATIIRDAIIKSDRSEKTVQKILESSGSVTLIMRTENEKLKEMKLNSKMPSGWKLNDDSNARYKTAGIEIVEYKLNVKGAIVR